MHNYKHIDTLPLSFADWTDSACARLQAYWPSVDAQQLRSIAEELFSDPHRGLLSPRQAVDEWMQPIRQTQHSGAKHLFDETCC
jgi:hypothetical protein